MPRIFCVHCGIPVVVDPQGRCPEGHVLDRSGDPGPGELGRAHDAPGIGGHGPGDADRIDLADALRAVTGPSAAVDDGRSDQSGNAAHGGSVGDADGGPVDSPDTGSAGGPVGAADASDGDEPQPWVWDVDGAVGGDDDPEVPQDVDVPVAATTGDGPADDGPAGTGGSADRDTPAVLDADLDLFDELDDLGEPGPAEVSPAPDDDGDDGLAFLFDTDPRGGEPQPDGDAADGDAADDDVADGDAADPDRDATDTGAYDPSGETRPIPIVSALGTARAATPGAAIDPTNFTSRGGRVEEGAAGRGLRARLVRRRVS